MKYLLLTILFLSFMGCKEVNPFDPDEKVQFNVSTNNRYVQDAEYVKIKSAYYVLDIGKLPMTIKATEGETLTAEFRSRKNLEQCSCVAVGGGLYDCVDEFVVNGSDWAVAE